MKIQKIQIILKICDDIWENRNFQLNHKQIARSRLMILIEPQDGMDFKGNFGLPIQNKKKKSNPNKTFKNEGN